VSSIDEIIQQIEKLQNLALMRLKTRCEQLIKSSQESLDKIENLGLMGYYSVNHDCYRYACDVHRISNELGNMRAIKENIIKIKNTVTLVEVVEDLEEE